MRVLLVDDERSIRLTLGDALEDAGHSVRRAESFKQGKEALEAAAVDCVITDLRMPDGSGIDLLPLAREKSPDAALLVITAHQTIETAIQATKNGADYLLKPFLNEEVLARLSKIEELRRLRAELAELKTHVTQRQQIDRIIGKTPSMQELFNTIETVGPSDVTVLIAGESGTGKEIVAQALHRNSPRCTKPLIKLSCAALPENLLEDELFGHEKGAFTDAKERKPGRFEMADGGSIFLDDIDDMSLRTQVKLLRVLQEREFERLGGTKTIKIDVRVITASKVDLSMLVRQGRFRDDLYFRLHVVELRLPPLRERLSDLPLLAQHFVRKHGGGRDYSITPEAFHKMSEYQWPGNVRELENAIMRAIAMAGAALVLNEKYLLQRPAAMRGGSAILPAVGGTLMAPGTRASSAGDGSVNPSSPQPSFAQQASAPQQIAARVSKAEPETFGALRDVIEAVERDYIIKVLEHTGGNKTKAAVVLDISRKNLWEKMRDFGLLTEKEES